jgi:VanZ family protein
MGVEAPAGPARGWALARSWARPLAYAAVIYGLASRSSFPISLDAPGLDKVLHAGEYAGLALLLALALLQSGLSPLRAAAIAALGATTFGATDEWHQSFVPGRDASLLDLVADAVGAVAGGALLVGAGRRRAGAGRSA